MGSCTAQCKMLLFCANVVRESAKFELARLKKEEEEEEEEEEENRFGAVLSRRFFTTLGVFWARKTLEDE